MILKFIDHDLICQRDLADRNLIFTQAANLLFLTSVDINGIFDIRHSTKDHLRAKLKEEVLAILQLLVVHPQQRCCNGRSNLRTGCN